MWIKACNRPHCQLNIEKLRDYNYVCSKHFVGGFGPTENHPNPLTADTYCARQHTGRKRPKPRGEIDETVSKKKCNLSEIRSCAGTFTIKKTYRNSTVRYYSN